MNYIQLNVIIFLTVLEDCISKIPLVIYEVNFKPSSFLLVSLVNLWPTWSQCEMCMRKYFALEQNFELWRYLYKSLDSNRTTTFRKCKTLRILCPFFGGLSQAKSRNFTRNRCNWKFSMRLNDFPNQACHVEQHKTACFFVLHCYTVYNIQWTFFACKFSLMWPHL